MPPTPPVCPPSCPDVTLTSSVPVPDSSIVLDCGPYGTSAGCVPGNVTVVSDVCVTLTTVPTRVTAVTVQYTTYDRCSGSVVSTRCVVNPQNCCNPGPPNSCCSQALQAVLYATLTGACTCANTTVTLHYDPINDMWWGSATVPCGSGSGSGSGGSSTVYVVIGVGCRNGVWCVGGYCAASVTVVPTLVCGSPTPSPAVCSPFHLTFTSTNIGNGCCTPTVVTIDITE